MRGEDVLADEVVRRGPEAFEARIRGAVAGCGDVIGQRVEPDVGDVLRVEGQLDAPGQALFRPGDAQIAERLAGWVEPEPRYRRGVLANYATLVASASAGAVTLSRYESA